MWTKPLTTREMMDWRLKESNPRKYKKLQKDGKLKEYLENLEEEWEQRVVDKEMELSRMTDETNLTPDQVEGKIKILRMEAERIIADQMLKKM